MPADGSTNLDPSLLVIRLLVEIAQEIHDTIMRSAREWSDERQRRDGAIRDAIRSSGDERRTIEGLLALTNKGVARGKSDRKWLEVTQMALKALASWTRG